MKETETAKFYANTNSVHKNPFSHNIWMTRFIRTREKYYLHVLNQWPPYKQCPHKKKKKKEY